MSDKSEPMRVVLEKDDMPDVSFEQGTFDMVGVRVENAVPKSDLRELVKQWREQREDVLDRETATNSAKAHRNGVACGMDYCIEELEELVDG